MIFDKIRVEAACPGVSTNRYQYVDRTQRLRTLTTPCLVVHGRDDTLVRDEITTP